MNVLKSPDLYVVYYPRSAGKYFAYNYVHMTRIEAVHLHEIEFLSKENVVSIVRAPVEAIASTIVSGLIRENIYDLEDSINFHVDEYISMHSEILESAATIIKFEDVVNSFNLVARKISSIFDHRIVNRFADRKPKDIDDYIPSSKSDHRYDDICQAISNHPKINICNQVYAKMLSRTVEV